MDNVLYTTSVNSQSTSGLVQLYMLIDDVDVAYLALPIVPYFNGLLDA